MGLRNPPARFASSGTPPTGAVGESIPRLSALGASQGLTSGRLSMTAIRLRAGDLATSITWMSGSTVAAGLTGLWVALFDEGRNLLRQSVNDAAPSWAASSPKTVDLSAPYRIQADGVYYAGVCEVGATPNNLACMAVTSTLMALVPLPNGTADTGLTTTAPAQAIALTVGASIPYVYVS